MLVFLASLQFLRTVELAGEEQRHRESLAANELLLRNWIEVTNQPIRRFVQDYAQDQALGAFLQKPDRAWAETHLRGDLERHGGHVLWLFDPSGRLVYTVQRRSGPALPPPPDRSGGSASYFMDSPDGLLEIWASPLASVRVGAASPGRLVAARLWDPVHVDRLARLSDTTLALTGAATSASDPDRERLLPLLGPDGAAVRHLVMRPARAADPVTPRPPTAAYLFLIFGILMVIALWLAIRRWVLRPLEYISESLSGNNPPGIQPLLQERSEMGRIAHLVVSSSRQKADLGREIEEHRRTEEALRESEVRLREALDLRARLARDLHDGVIQSIYAAGLGLEGAMSQLGRDPDGARARLQLCRQSLNDVIREVRGFISGIEPEALHHQGFSQELTALVRTMQALWPVVIEIDASPAVVARLTSTHELHALQICRECISNAVRHGGARLIKIRLEESAGVASLRVIDNGRGFVPENVPGTGSGLGNLSARAREMGGELRVESRVKHGTTVIVAFPLPGSGDPA